MTTRYLLAVASCILAALTVSGCASDTSDGGHSAEAAMDAVDRAVNMAAAPVATLDRFHAAASRADFKAYFAQMTEDAVFLGTDATERWDRKAFEAYCKPYFDQGKGWTYRPRDRHIAFGPEGSRTAWFDELLDNDNYGTCRGSGVLVRGDDGVWRIAQYNLSMPVPNDLARDLVRMIREMPKK